MLQKQKITSIIRHFLIYCATPVAMRGALLFVSMGLVGVSISAHHVSVQKYPVTTHIAAVTTVTPPKTTALVVTTPTPTPVAAPAPVITPSPTPTTTPKLNPAVSVPTVVTPSPSSSIDSLKPTTSNSNNSNSNGNTVTGSSVNGSFPHSSSYSSTNWSGYMAATGTFSGITASWVVPNVAGNGRTITADGTWIGIGGVTSGDLIQTGTQDIVSASGQVSMAAFYEMLPDASVTITDMAISPGDLISASIKEVALDIWTIAITDSTDSDSYTTTVTYMSANSSAEWIEEDPNFANGTQVPFDDFGSVSFTNTTAILNGKSIALGSTNPSSITLTNLAGKAIAVPSAINTAGTGFSVTYQ